MCFPNLIGQAKVHGLSQKQMGEIIGVSDRTFVRKCDNGSFTVTEINRYMEYFDKDYKYLFYTEPRKEG